MENAIQYLKENGVEAFEQKGILVIPTDSPEVLDAFVRKVRKLLQDCGYEKSWSISTYYYEREQERSKYGY